MRSKLTSRRALVAIVGVVFALSWVLPAVGASPAKLAHKALATANQALRKANSALGLANGAQSSANKAQATADKALTTAQNVPLGARAYARMDNPCATSSACAIDHAKGISGIRQTSTGGLYCVTAPGLSPNTTAWTVSVDIGDTGGPGDEAGAMPNSNGAACNSDEFEVQTTRVAKGNATNVAFFIVIP